MAGDTVWPDELFVDLERTGPVPLYYQVSHRLEQAIRNGTIPSGARLENEISIAQRLQVSRPTIRRAIQELVDKGLVVRRRGIGTQVVQGQVTREVELTSLYEDMQGSHHEPATKVLELDIRPADAAVAEALSLPEGTDIVHIRRLRLGDGVPVAVLENHLPITFGDLTIEQLETHGLYQLMRGRGVAIRVAKQRIGARRAHDDESELLDIAQGGPVLTMDRIAFDSSGTAIEHGHHCYRPEIYSFETTLVAK